jgi:hypothetical protein
MYLHIQFVTKKLPPIRSGDLRMSNFCVYFVSLKSNLSLSFETALPNSYLRSVKPLGTVFALANLICPYPVLRITWYPFPHFHHQAIYRFNLKYHKNEKDNCYFSYHRYRRYRFCILRFFPRRLCHERRLCRIWSFHGALSYHAADLSATPLSLPKNFLSGYRSSITFFCCRPGPPPA